MNNIICKGKGCNIPINKDSNNILGKFYKCNLCQDEFCVNCMYLFCPLCKIYFACFWCGWKHKYDNLKCDKCKTNS